MFVPANSIRIGAFSGIYLPSICGGTRDTITREKKNLIECLQCPFGLSLRNPKNSVSITGILSLRLFVVQGISLKEGVQT